MADQQHSLTAGQSVTVRAARVNLATSHRMSLGAASEDDLRRNIGRLEISLEQALRVLDELLGGE
jgi:hypothetical protein